ncbi:MAG: hypothetical protein ACJ0DH_11355 [bacterium]
MSGLKKLFLISLSILVIYGLFFHEGEDDIILNKTKICNDFGFKDNHLYECLEYEYDDFIEIINYLDKRKTLINFYKVIYKNLELNDELLEFNFYSNEKYIKLNSFKEIKNIKENNVIQMSGFLYFEGKPNYRDSSIVIQESEGFSGKYSEDSIEIDYDNLNFGYIKRFNKSSNSFQPICVDYQFRPICRGDFKIEIKKCNNDENVENINCILNKRKYLLKEVNFKKYTLDEILQENIVKQKFCDSLPNDISKKYKKILNEIFENKKNTKHEVLCKNDMLNLVKKEIFKRIKEDKKIRFIYIPKELRDIFNIEI